MAWIQGSGSGGAKRKTEVSIGITQSIQMDRIQSVHGHDQDSYEERKIVTVAYCDGGFLLSRRMRLYYVTSCRLVLSLYP